jgi:hypothetical protein
MFKNKDLLILQLSQTDIECVFVCGRSTPNNIVIESSINYSFNQSEMIDNHIYQVPSIIQTIKRHNYHNDLVAWVINEPLIESFLVDPSKKLPKNDLATARSFYHQKNSVNYYCDSISQALLLQIRLISYGLDLYCLSPVSRFFLLLSLYNNHAFNCNNNKNESFPQKTLEQFFSYNNAQKIIPFQKNIDQKNYHSYILVYGLLTLNVK